MSINRVKCGLAKHALISVSVGSPPQMASANHFALMQTQGSGYYGIPDAATYSCYCFGLCFVFISRVFSQGETSAWFAEYNMRRDSHDNACIYSRIKFLAKRRYLQMDTVFTRTV